MVTAAGLVVGGEVAEVAEVVQEVSHFRIARFNPVHEENTIILEAETSMAQCVDHP